MLRKLTKIVQQQLLWRLFRRLGASLHDIRITCVVPFYTPSHEFAVARLSLQELEVQPIELGLPRFGFQASAKDFRLHGLKLDLGLAIIPPVFNDLTGSEFEYADNDIIVGVRRLHMTALLNPLCVAGSLAYQPATTLTGLPTLSGNVEVSDSAVFHALLWLSGQLLPLTSPFSRCSVRDARYLAAAFRSVRSCSLPPSISCICFRKAAS